MLCAISASPLAMRRASAVIIALSLIGAAARPSAAQRMIVHEDANLRPAPARKTTPIGTLLAGDTVTVLDSGASHGYLHVRASGTGRDGWVYERLVRPLSEDETKRVAAVGDADVTDAPASYHGCSLKGNPSTSGADYGDIVALNELKNRYHAPTEVDIDTAVTLEQLLAPGDDHGRFDENKGAVIEGVVDAVKVGGVETVNCKARDTTYRDTHIEISLRSGDPETKRVIVEVTPRWRAAMAEHGVDWSTDALNAGLVGQRVRFRGWLLFDAEHANAAEHTNPGNARDWRATVWEIHPVTSFEILGPAH